MTKGRALSWRWGAMLAAGAATATMPVSAQSVFAAGAVGLLGLPHGASDLAVVPAVRRGSFLVGYGLAIVLVVALWSAAPLPALVAFLILSAVHFAADGGDGDTRRGVGSVAGWAVGVSIVAGPALLHRAALSSLFDAVVHQPDAVAMLVTVMRLVAVLALVPVVRALPAGEPIAGSTPMAVATGLFATLVLPPLVGFACGFVLLHARGQTLARQRRLGCATLGGYMRRVAPVLAGAAVVLAGVAVLLSRAMPDHIAMLFAGIAALAVPHMLVTPLWRREPAVSA